MYTIAIHLVLDAQGADVREVLVQLQWYAPSYGD